MRFSSTTLVVLIFIAAIGIIVRLFVRITILPGLELTPGFTFSELGGVIGGVIGGVLVGAIVGLGGALAGGEVPLLPMIGNICLGVGTGIAVFIDKSRSSIKYYVAVVIGGAIIGGLLPSLVIYMMMMPLEPALLLAAIDMAQAALWAIVALIIYRTIIIPLVGTYLSTDMQ